LVIDPPDEPMEMNHDSMSPIVIHDRMLSHSAVGAPSAVQHFKSLFTAKDMEIYRAIQQGVNVNGIDVMNSDNITSILRDLDQQDYDDVVPVNEILQII
jgi:hypothetical protein